MWIQKVAGTGRTLLLSPDCHGVGVSRMVGYSFRCFVGRIAGGVTVEHRKTWQSGARLRGGGLSIGCGLLGCAMACCMCAGLLVSIVHGTSCATGADDFGVVAQDCEEFPGTDQAFHGVQ